MPVKKLSTSDFKVTVFNSDNCNEWRFLGNRSALIYFYADWCRPCQALAPIMDQLANEYESKLDFYKIDTDKEPELTAQLAIQCIPTLLFIPKHGQPKIQNGVLPKCHLRLLIENELIDIGGAAGAELAGAETHLPDLSQADW